MTTVDQIRDAIQARLVELDAYSDAALALQRFMRHGDIRFATVQVVDEIDSDRALARDERAGEETLRYHRLYTDELRRLGTELGLLTDRDEEHRCRSCGSMQSQLTDVCEHCEDKS